MSTRNQLLLALGLAVAVRLACLGLVDYHFDVGDASSYRASALKLLEHGTYTLSVTPPWEPTAFRPPLYAAFSAAIASVSPSISALRFAQLLLSLGQVVLLWLVARRLVPRAATWVLFLGALSPFDAVYVGAGLSECLTSFLLVAALSGLVLLDGTRRVLVAGVALGLACLARDVYVALVPFGAVAWVVFGGASRRQRLGQALAVSVVAALVVVPWTIRNAVHFHRFIPVSAGRLGYSLWLGAWATNAEFTASDATGRVYPAEAFRDPAERELVAEAERDMTAGDAVFRRLFNERLRAEPVQVVGRWLKRWPKLWLGTRFDIFELHPRALPRGSPQWTVVKAGLWGLNALLFFGALVGALLALRRREPVAWMLLPIAFTSLLFLPLNSFENRYSQPMLPFVVLLAASAIVAAREWLSQRKSAAVLGGAQSG